MCQLFRMTVDHPPPHPPPSLAGSTEDRGTQVKSCISVTRCVNFSGRETTNELFVLTYIASTKGNKKATYLPTPNGKKTLTPAIFGCFNVLLCQQTLYLKRQVVALRAILVIGTQKKQVSYVGCLIWQFVPRATGVISSLA